jgi:hypothetical protein
MEAIQSYWPKNRHEKTAQRPDLRYNRRNEKSRRERLRS